MYNINIIKYNYIYIVFLSIVISCVFIITELSIKTIQSLLIWEVILLIFVLFPTILILQLLSTIKKVDLNSNEVKKVQEAILYFAIIFILSTLISWLITEITYSYVLYPTKP
jgi:hypothetical protein